MKIEKIKLEDLRPLEKNVRKHNDKQIAELVRSLNQFGQTRAIIVDEHNNILIGNGLYMAMKSRGDTEAECSRVVGLTENQKKKLVISDNKVFTLGIDDYTVITEFINDITLDGDFDIAGFDDEVVRQMTKELNEVNADVMNYGSISADAVKAQENTNIPHHTETREREENTPQPVYEPHRPIEQANTVAPVKTDRTIICPSCGEVIHLD